LGRACSAYGGEAYTGLWWGNLRERDHWGDPGADGRIILRRIFGEWRKLHNEELNGCTAHPILCE